MKDLSDDFADVDIREELCYAKPPEKSKITEEERRKSARREDCGNRKRVSAMPQTAALSASVALFGNGKDSSRFAAFFCLFFVGSFAAA